MPVEDAEERISDLFQRHHHEVLAYCVRRIGWDAADDVAAGVFAVAWRRIDEIAWNTARPWLFGIARRVISNRWRSRSRRGRLRERIGGLAEMPAESPEVMLVRTDEDQEVIEGLGKLRPSDQEVLRLAAWEELTATEIGIALGISTGAAEQRLHRAKKPFARLFKPQSGHSAVSPRGLHGEGGP